MIDGSEKCNRQFAFDLENSHVCESAVKVFVCNIWIYDAWEMYLFEVKQWYCHGSIQASGKLPTYPSPKHLLLTYGKMMG